MKKIKLKWVLLLYIPIYLIVFYIVEQVITDDSEYWASNLPIDNFVPFIPFFVVFYVSWYVYMIGAIIYLLLKDEDEYKKFMFFMIIGYSVSLIIFFIFPNGQDLRPSIESMGNDIFSNLIKKLYQADTHTNVLPSMHVTGCIGVTIAVIRSKSIPKVWMKLGITVWGSIIAISTIFIKQHSVLDGIASVVLCFIIYILVYVVFNKKKKIVNEI